ncbi:phosphatidylinositol 4-kinase (macronuclear) [Tetrahymena thermophila SB210]|uniref:1-phosphatidylinositol 4-kinase n=1 Tax=Tetrahymena thermophila (strain SB210) TaxID=312017 RepID=W7XA81_TETTS|nr:phosphatidylinositol 4-kinase [Tetrahymena thermophila SB210]EWS73288.1 phosphatidylinositol 4-kinase [Tetrahymena thermophila SB210]|eukprot:XP_012654197.1 phosphatidylinositol 4-kinase [Tetrahymena thermophila SB210]
MNKRPVKETVEQKRPTWFSKLPVNIEELQQTGALLGITTAPDDSFSQSPTKDRDSDHISTKELFKLFNRKDFKIDQLLKHFYYQYTKIGIHDYLVNKLYSYGEADLNFYMSELCYLYITRDSEMLKKFLVDMSSRSINLYLLIYWSLDSFSESLKLDEAKKAENERIKDLLKTVENSFINASMQSSLIQENKTPSQVKESNERAKYNNSIKTFIKNMVNISLTLKKHEQDERKDKLKMYMKRANKWLKNLREQNPNNEFFQGIFIPFREDYNQQLNSTFIVRIVHEEVTCFNTKMRVPYRVAIETIDINELKQVKKKVVSETDLDDVGIIGDGPEFSENNNDQAETSQQSVIKQNESTDKINKYGRTFSIWACEAENQEIKLNEIRNSQMKIQKKGELVNLLNQDEELTSVEKFHRLYKKSKSLVPDDSAFRALKKFQKNFKLQETFLEGERLQKYQENIKRFNIYFKEKKNVIQRRSSIVTDRNVNNPFRERHQYVNAKEKLNLKKRRKVSLKDLKVIDVLRFFKHLQRNYPQFEKEIQMIYKHLHYDELEEQIEHTKISNVDLLNEDEDISQKQISSFSIKRKFPWEDVWEDKIIKIKRESPYGQFKSYKLRAVIFKGGDDLRQELLAMQLIYKFQSIFQKANLQLWLRPYEIIVTSASSGIIEFLPNTYSIDGLKKKVPKFTCLYDFYKDYFGKQFQQAQSNFIESLAGYSIVCYLLQFKDRHNGNILIDNSGHLIHIDYGFMFCISPGGINFENAPFKLTKEYAQLMGGKESEGFERYKNLVFQGFKELQKYVDEIIFLVQIMQEESDLPCFRGFDIKVFRERFQEHLDEKNLLLYVNKLINDSYDNWRTKQYDNFQKMTNGIAP